MSKRRNFSAEFKAKVALEAQPVEWIVKLTGIEPATSAAGNNDDFSRA